MQIGPELLGSPFETPIEFYGVPGPLGLQQGSPGTVGTPL